MYVYNKKQNNMRKILVVVDVQKDFYHPDGALYVKGGELLPEKISKIMPQFDNIIFTLDYHPYNHCSFKDNGGTWPVHCVRGTEGSSLPNEFLPFLVEDSDFVYKGEFCDAEEFYIEDLFEKDGPEEVSLDFSINRIETIPEKSETSEYRIVSK